MSCKNNKVIRKLSKDFKIPEKHLKNVFKNLDKKGREQFISKAQQSFKIFDERAIKTEPTTK